MDPATFDSTKIKMLRSLGINRVSMGVQSFDDTTLRHIGRAHKVQDVYEAIESVVEGGIEVNFVRYIIILHCLKHVFYLELQRGSDKCIAVHDSR